MSSCANAGVRRLRLLASITRTQALFLARSVNESVNVHDRRDNHCYCPLMK